MISRFDDSSHWHIVHDRSFLSNWGLLVTLLLALLPAATEAQTLSETGRWRGAYPLGPPGSTGYVGTHVMAVGAMAVFAFLCHIAPAALIGIFSQDPQVIAVGDEYLRIISWNFVASGVIFVASSMFQAMGNTVPALQSSFVRVLLVVFPAVLLSRQPGFQLRGLWYLSVAAITLQMILSLLLLRREFRLRLGTPAAAPAAKVPV